MAGSAVTANQVGKKIVGKADEVAGPVPKMVKLQSPPAPAASWRETKGLGSSAAQLTSI